MLAALEAELGGDVAWSRPEGGYFVWLDLPDGVDAAELLERATAAGVTFVRGARLLPGGAGGRSSARLAFSYESPARIAEGVARPRRTSSAGRAARGAGRATRPIASD